MTPSWPAGVHLLVDANRYPHQHVLRPLHNPAVDAQQVGTLQCLQYGSPTGPQLCGSPPLCEVGTQHGRAHLETEVVVVKVAVVDDLTVQALSVLHTHECLQRVCMHNNLREEQSEWSATCITTS